MTKTEYYSLNQWTLSDRVRMEDFNHDNAQIDAALHALAGKNMITKLKTFTVSTRITGTTIFTMDVSDINWSAWQYVYVDLALLGSGYMLLYPNGNANGASSSGYVTSSTYKSLAGMLECGYDTPVITRAEFQVFRNGAQTLRTVCSYKRITGSASNDTYNTLQTLHLVPYDTSYYMNSGSTITFWGVR